MSEQIEAIPPFEKVRQILAAACVQIKADGDDLLVTAPPGKLTDELRGLLALHKSQLITELQSYPMLAGDGPHSLPPMAKAYWVGHVGALQLATSASYYMELVVDPAIAPQLQMAVDAIVARHPMLRAEIDSLGEMRFSATTDAPVVRIHDGVMSDVDMAALRLKIRERLSQKEVTYTAAPAFDIEMSVGSTSAHLHLLLPLWRFDAWSTYLLLEELLRPLAPKTTPAPKVPAALVKLIGDQLPNPASGRRQASIAYWEERANYMAGPPALPMLPNAQEVRFPKFAHLSEGIEAEFWEKFKAEARRRSLSPSMALCAAYCHALGRFSRSRNFTITSLHSTRTNDNADAWRTIGNFGDTHCLEVEMQQEESFEGFAFRLQRQAWADRSHDSVSGIEVAAMVRRVQGFQPGATFPHTFTVAPAPTGPKGEPSLAATLVPEAGRLSVPQVHLDHQVFESATSAQLNFDYAEGIFPAGLIESIFDYYCSTIRQLAEDPEAWSRPFPCKATDPQQDNLLESMSSGARLESGFLANATRYPDRPALRCGGEALSYRGLHTVAQRVASDLILAGVQSGDRVAILMRKGWQQIAGVLGALMADAVYVPILLDTPELRRNAIIEDCGVAAVLVAGPDSIDGLPEVPVVRVSLEPPSEGPIYRRDILKSPIAYIIYTSGTTGKPKGVVIEHGAACNTIDDINSRFGITRSDVVLGLSALSFDLSVYDIFGTLAVGGTLVLPTAEQERDPLHWLELVRDEKVTVWNSVPALMQLATEASVNDCSVLANLRLIMLSGDWIPVTLPQSIQKLAPRSRIVSLGGATEAAIWSVLYEIDHVDPSWRSIPYGKAMKGQAIYVLDDELFQAPMFMPGEIYIGGVGLANGYWGDVERSARQFVKHPRTGERLYRTGDIGRLLLDGNIEFLGREDHQVKIQGYRVECADVEAAILRLEGVKSAAVAAVPDRAGGKALCAYIVPRLGVSLGTDALRVQMAARLPGYMVPAIILIMDDLPLSANGKVDRARLIAPPLDIPVSARKELVAPRDRLERVLADVWSDILGGGEIGIHESFFDLGGSSFAGMRMAAKLNTEHQLQVQLSALVANPTIAALADVIRKQGHIGYVPVRRLAGDPAFPSVHLFHPIGGNVVCYSAVAAELAPRFNVLGVTARGLESDLEPFSSMEEMVAEYALAILGEGAKSPYLLAGWSMGGLIAAEVGRYLAERGFPVAVLMIDSDPGDVSRGANGGIALLREFAADLQASLGNSPGPVVNLSDRASFDTNLALIAASLGIENVTVGEIRQLARNYQIFSANLAALRIFEPARYPFGVHALVASRSQPSVRRGDFLSKFPEVNRETLAGDHYSIMRPDRAGELAAIIHSWVNRETAKAERLEAFREIETIIREIRGSGDEMPLSEAQEVGPTIGLSSIQTVRLLARLEARLDRDLSVDFGDSFSIKKIVDLLIEGRRAR